MEEMKKPGQQTSKEMKHEKCCPCCGTCKTHEQSGKKPEQKPYSKEMKPEEKKEEKY